MKVLFATHFFPPGHEGGTESYTLGLVKMLARLGHTTSVICAENWGLGSDWRPGARSTEYAGIPVRRVSWNWSLAPDPFHNLYDNVEIENLFARHLDEIAPDVVHITSCYSLGVGIIRAAKRAGIPTVLTLTDFWFISPRQTLTRTDGTLCGGPTSTIECARCMGAQSGVYRRLAASVPEKVVALGFAAAGRWPVLARRPGLRGHVGDVVARGAVLRRAFDDVGAAIAPSRALFDMFTRNGYPADRMRLSRYGQDTSWVASVRPRPSSNRPVVGYIGQLEPIKGVDLLVQAFQRLRGRVPAELKVFGGLEKNRAFSNRLRALATDNPDIRFMGGFERAQLADVFSGIDVVVVPSVWFENAPIVIAEAFAAGRPVIATNLPGMTELVEHDVNGLLFRHSDVDDLAGALHRVLTDPSLRDRLACGIQPVRRIEDEAAELVHLYTSLVNSQTAVT